MRSAREGFPFLRTAIFIFDSDRVGSCTSPGVTSTLGRKAGDVRCWPRLFLRTPFHWAQIPDVISQAFGLNIPPEVLAIANEVIE